MNIEEKKLGTFPVVLGGMSFIPLIGILFGIVCILWGIFTKKKGGKKLAIVGGAGIFFTIIIYSAAFYFGVMQREGAYDDLRAKLGKTVINNLIPSIELYKIQNGKYPKSLEELSKSLPKNSMTFINDPSISNIKNKSKNFYYELNSDGSGYYLLGVGADGVPFTKDDILPEVKSKEGIGFRIKKSP